MLSTRDLYRQIRSIGETAQITKAMQMVATSKMRKAQQAALAGRPFVRQLYRIQRHATAHASDFTHPLLEAREVRKRAIILIAADKGLCGALNSNVFRLASEFDPQSTVFIVAGQKAAQFVARSGRTLAGKFNYSDTPHYTEAKEIAAFASDLFLKGEVDEVKIVATRFVNTLTQQAVCVEYLPVDEITGLPVDGWEPDQETEQSDVQFLFEPGPESLLSYLLPHYLNIYIYQVLLNAKASEQSARMVSMKNATENAERLIKELTLELNKARQDNITKELLDIAGGKSGSD
jgi:F-type H+-transporting ATPase subunit gamma